MIVKNIYFLKGYTAPKVYLGTHFECLLTDQKINANALVERRLGPLSEWKKPIFKPERFDQ